MTPPDPDHDVSHLDDGDEPLDAGPLAAWLVEVDGALRGGEADVPCGSCDACCRASQFVHVAPDEHEALAAIPAALRFPAPGLPAGHVLLGYDEQGRCPMLTDAGCSIYDRRPRTCRSYDCRIFAAAGLRPDEAAKAGVAERADRWRFRLATAAEGAELEAIRAAATRLAARPDLAPAAAVGGATQLAGVAVGVRSTFRRGDPGDDEVRAAVHALRPR